MTASVRKIYKILFDTDMPDGPLGLREKGKIAKVAKILKAARAMFSTVEYESVKMDEIAARANVSKATLYAYFETKEMVLVALFAQTQDKIDAGRMQFLAGVNLSQPVTTFAAYEVFLNETGIGEFPVNLWRVLYASRVTNRAHKPGALLAGISTSIMEDRIHLLSRMIDVGALKKDMDIDSMARVLHALGRLHWETFICDPSPDLQKTNALNAVDIACVLKPYLA